MAKSESKGTGDLGKHRPQVPSSVPAGKPAATAAEVQSRRHQQPGVAAAQRSCRPSSGAIAS